MFRTITLAVALLVSDSQAIKVENKAVSDAKIDQALELYNGIDMSTFARMQMNSKEDLKALNVDADKKDKVEKAAAEALELLDENGDGEVTFKEAIKVIFAAVKKEYPSVSKATLKALKKMYKKIFDAGDTDGSGSLNIKEIEKLAASMIESGTDAGF